MASHCKVQITWSNFYLCVWKFKKMQHNPSIIRFFSFVQIGQGQKPLQNQDGKTPSFKKIKSTVAQLIHYW